MKVHPIPHAILKPQIQGLFQFCINVQCHERLLLCIYVAQTLYTLEKKSPSKRNVETLSGWVKIHQIAHVTFETSSQFFFNLCITIQCRGR